MAFFKLIRYQNLILLALMQFIFRYGFLELQNVPLALNDWQYALLVLATLCIAAGGYLINNIFDQETDAINKPNDVVIGKSISENTAYSLYAVLNIVGVGCGFIIANMVEKPSLSAIFIVISITLYLYATSFKQSLLVGNVIIAILTSLSIIIIGIFDLYPILNPENNSAMGVLFKVLLDYALFCFIINFIRELVKDLEDVDGDFNQGMSTLPIVLGVSRTRKVVFGLSFIPLILLVWYIKTYYITFDLYIGALYTFIFIVAPLLYFTIKIINSKTKKDFHHLSNVLKLVIFFGILSVLVITLNIRYNA